MRLRHPGAPVEVEMDDAFRAAKARSPAPGPRCGRAWALRAVGGDVMRADARSCTHRRGWLRRTCRRARRMLSPIRISPPCLVIGAVLIGGSEKTRAVVRSRGMAVDLGGRAELRDPALMQRRGVAAEQQAPRSARWWRRRRCSCGRRRAWAARRAAPRAACSRDWRAARRAG